jgi:predicted metal-dependent phosphoesterase TrpH
MVRTRRAPWIGGCVAVVAVGLLLHARFDRATRPEGAAPAGLQAAVLRAAGPERWFRGNLHTHSLWSDGNDYPESIALWYREHGYDFLCFTDHNVLPVSEKWIDVEKSAGGRTALDRLVQRLGEKEVERRTVADRLEVRLARFDETVARVGLPGKFLLVQGEEISDRFGKYPIHLNASNVTELVVPRGGQSVLEAVQSDVDAVLAQRKRTGRPTMVHLNHPNFGWAITAEELARVRGERFFEVYNGHPGVRNSGDALHASAERIWDVVLTRRIAELGLVPMFGLATDDGHNYPGIPRGAGKTGRASEPGRGWVMVLAAELTPAALIESLEAGRFYASSGVALERVESTSKHLEVAVRPDDGVTYCIEFVGTRKGYDGSSQPVVDADGKEVRTTRRYSDDIGRVLRAVDGTTARYEFVPDDLYVRARITSSRRHPNPSEVGESERAWTQPALGPAAPRDLRD